jgi:hypothetical protein
LFAVENEISMAGLALINCQQGLHNAADYIQGLHISKDNRDCIMPRADLSRIYQEFIRSFISILVENGFMALKLITIVL